MENKYYTPSIEEFCDGFKYEKRVNTIGEKIEAYFAVDGEIVKVPDYVCTEEDWAGKEFSLSNSKEQDIEKLLEEDRLRVKYLDKEDIKSLGFEKSKKNQWVGYEDYFSGNVRGEYGYFLYVTIHYPIFYTKSKRVEDNLFKIIVHRHYTSNEDETSNINYSLNTNESEVVFKGTIKNKHELKRVLIMLGIM